MRISFWRFYPTEVGQFILGGFLRYEISLCFNTHVGHFELQLGFYGELQGIVRVKSGDDKTQVIDVVRFCSSGGIYRRLKTNQRFALFSLNFESFRCVITFRGGHQTARSIDS